MELTDTVVAVWQDFCDDEGATSPVRKFGYGAVGGRALDLDCRGHNVIDFESLEVAGCVGSGGCIAAAIFSEVSDNVGGKFGLGLAKAKEFVEVVDIVVVAGGLRDG